jgi:hypothetical protein
MEGVMQTLTVQGVVTKDGVLRLEVPCDMPPGPVEVEITIRQRVAKEAARFDWASLYGLGKEIWEGVDAVEYIRELREDRELP